jgi:hypothetical protein
MYDCVVVLPPRPGSGGSEQFPVTTAAPAPDVVVKSTRGGIDISAAAAEVELVLEHHGACHHAARWPACICRDLSPGGSVIRRHPDIIAGRFVVIDICLSSHDVEFSLKTGRHVQYARPPGGMSGSAGPIHPIRTGPDIRGVAGPELIESVSANDVEQVFVDGNCVHVPPPPARACPPVRLVIMRQNHAPGRASVDGLPDLVRCVLAEESARLPTTEKVERLFEKKQLRAVARLEPRTD